MKRSMRVWVTGADGLLGRALQKVLRHLSIDYAGSSRKQVDVCKLGSLMQFLRQCGPFTHVIHCAAYTKVDLAESHAEEARQVNALSPALMGLLAAETGMRVVHISTDYVFDGLGHCPYREEDSIAPGTTYGKTKAEGEQRLLAVHPSACIIRTSWLFGEDGQGFPSAILRQMQERERLLVIADQKGRPTYAPDLAAAIIRALDWSGVYHMANTGETTWHGFAEAIREEKLARDGSAMCRCEIIPISSNQFSASAKRPAYSVLETKKAEDQLGFRLRHWREGLRECMNRTRGKDAPA